MGHAIVIGNWENVFICVLTLLLFTVPSFSRRALKIGLPNTLEIIILLFIFAAEILGELQCYYLQFEHWDTMLHTVSGFLLAAIGFSLVDILNRDTKIKFTLSPVFVAVVAFCFAMTAGALWEIGEFGVDVIFNKDSQKDTVIHEIHSTMLNEKGYNVPVTLEDITEASVNGEELGLGGYLDIGLYDTMEDMIVCLIGAVVFCFIGYIYIKHRGKASFAAQFIPVYNDSE